jgi:hypothetical protein
MALIFYKAVRLVGRKVWQLAVPDELRVVGPDEQLAGEKLPAQMQLEVRQGAQWVAEQDAPFEVAEEQVGPLLEALAARLWLRVGQRVRRAELDARLEAVEELAVWPVADSGVRFAATRLVPEAVR